MIVWLDDAADMAGVVGPKAAALARLRHAGLPVPDGFAVTVEASEAHVRDAGAADAVERLYAAVETGGDWRPRAAALRATLATARLSDDVTAALRAAVHKLRPPRAVRSSALAEDQAGASFAGLFATMLGLNDGEQVLTAVGACWASRFSDTAIRYAVGRGVDVRRMRMAVIIQQAIDAHCAGGALSRDLGGGMSVSGAWGLGRAVADGQVTPDRWRLDRDSLAILERHIGTKRVLARLDSGGGEVWRQVNGDHVARACMTDRALARLGRLVLRAERVFGSAQEVEWALDRRGRLWLVQSRPFAAAGPVCGHDGHTAWSGGDQVLEGQPVSPGRAVGRARLRADLAHLGPGDILIAASLPPGTAAVLPRIGGLVLESAGSTAHAATLARERGVPAVFGVVGATRVLPEDALVVVDGTSGRIHYNAASMTRGLARAGSGRSPARPPAGHPPPPAVRDRTS